MRHADEGGHRRASPCLASLRLRFARLAPCRPSFAAFASRRRLPCSFAPASLAPRLRSAVRWPLTLGRGDDAGGRAMGAYAPPVARRDPLDVERRAARLVAAGAVGASVAHELRNALAVAESALFLAQRDLDDRAAARPPPRPGRRRDPPAHDVIGSVLGLARGEPVRREPAPVGPPRRRRAPRADAPPRNVTFEVAIEPPELDRALRSDPPRARLLEPVPQRRRGPRRAAGAAPS